MSALPIPYLAIDGNDNHQAASSPNALSVMMLAAVYRQMGPLPRNMGYLRSASKDGARAFNELVNTPLSPIPLCVELKKDGAVTQYIPLRLQQCIEGEEYMYTQAHLAEDGVICACLPRDLSNNTVILSNAACTTSVFKNVGLEILEGHPIGCLKMVSPKDKGIMDFTRVEPSWDEDTFGIQTRSVVLSAAFEDVTTIPDSFLSYLTKLPSIDISPLCNVTSIGDAFLYFCVSLKEINLTPLVNVNEIGTLFLSDCPSLRQVTGLNTLNNATSIGDDCLANCRLVVLSQQEVGTFSGLLKHALSTHFRPVRDGEQDPGTPGYLDARNHRSDEDDNDDIDDEVLRNRASQYVVRNDDDDGSDNY